MISLKEFASAMRPETRIVVERGGGSVETTTGAIWFELATTGNDLEIEHIEPHEDRVIVTVRSENGGKEREA